MDQSAQGTISDDQELAKVLAGVTAEADEAASQPSISTLPPDDSTVAEPSASNDEALPTITSTHPAPEPVPAAVPSPVITPSATHADSSLDSIKLDALNELRPLVDKLNVSAEEKFDTYLLLLRSTDDKALIAPAHDAAKAITDEARRAQALLDVIKEIDFLNQNQA